MSGPTHNASANGPAVAAATRAREVHQDDLQKEASAAVEIMSVLDRSYGQSNRNTEDPPGRWFFARRFLAAVMDYIVLGAFFFAYIHYFGTEADEGYQVSGSLHALVVFAAWVRWLPLPEAVWGRSFGKWACSLHVMSLDNGRITFGQALVRRLLDAVDFGGLFGIIGFIVARTDPLHQRLGDLVAKTRVVDDPMEPIA